MGKVYLDQPLDEEHECVRKQHGNKVRRDVNIRDSINIADKIGTPLELQEYQPRQIVENDHSINNSLLINDSPETQQKIESGLNKYGLNQFLSNLIPVNRTLPDMRTPWCRDKGMLMTRLPKASVIVTVHNEAWSVIIRMVHSVINTTPNKLLKEIILVDDASDMEHLRGGLDSYFRDFMKVKVLRMSKRVGFFISRNEGARLASAPVLIFLDANTECTPGWLEPLLDRIARNRSTIVSPSVDIIDHDTFEYNIAPYESVGGFNWNLMFSWKNIPDEDILKQNNPAEPLQTPTLPGGNYAIDREFFNILGQHDPVMDTMGFDNLELSIKCWLCGGRLEIVPCSHIGQVSRSYESMLLNKSKAILLNISMRTAEVWFDEYKTYFYDRVGDPTMDIGDTSSRLLIKKRLGCQPFQWYIENVYPDLFIPGYSLAAGEVRNPWSGLCIDSGVNSDHYFLPVKVFPCHNMGGHQYWMFSELGEIRRDEVCLDFGGEGDAVILYPCHGTGGNQQWMMDRVKRRMRHRQTKMCLTVSGNDTPAVPLPTKPEVRYLILKDCQADNSKQEWVWFWSKS